MRIASILATMCVAAVVQSGSSSTYLDDARGAAAWIQRSAIKTDAGLTWPADPADPKSVNAALYSGSPGVVLFMLELHHATKDPRYLADARAGADELLASLEQQRSAGLYTGLAGIGFTFGELYRASGDQKYAHGAALVVRM